MWLLLRLSAAQLKGQHCFKGHTMVEGQAAALIQEATQPHEALPAMQHQRLKADILPPLLLISSCCSPDLPTHQHAMAEQLPPVLLIAVGQSIAGG